MRNLKCKTLSVLAMLSLASSVFADAPATATSPSKWDTFLKLVDDAEVVYKQAHNGVVAVVAKTLDLRLRSRKDYPPTELGALPESMRVDALDLALIADAVYLKETSDIGNAVVYKFVDELTDADSGFKARVYQNAEKKKMVIAFEGTTGNLNSPKWLTNYANFLGTQPDQFKKAVEYVQTWQKKNDANKFEILLTGHSLGGGLATYAALSTGLKATTFNAAGVGNGLLEVLESSDAAKSRLKSAKDYVTNIDCKWDPISLMGGQLGQTYTLETPAPKFSSVPTTTREAADYLYDNILTSHFCSTIIKTLKTEPAKTSP